MDKILKYEELNLNSWLTHKKPGMVCKPVTPASTVDGRCRKTVEACCYQPSSRFNEGPCLLGIEWRAIELPFSGFCMHSHGDTPGHACVHTTHTEREVLEAVSKA